jgi:hypothetical protein
MSTRPTGVGRLQYQFRQPDSYGDGVDQAKKNNLQGVGHEDQAD